MKKTFLKNMIIINSAYLIFIYECMQKIDVLGIT